MGGPGLLPAPVNICSPKIGEKNFLKKSKKVVDILKRA